MKWTDSLFLLWIANMVIMTHGSSSHGSKAANRFFRHLALNGSKLMETVTSKLNIKDRRKRQNQHSARSFSQLQKYNGTEISMRQLERILSKCKEKEQKNPCLEPYIKKKYFIDVQPPEDGLEQKKSLQDNLIDSEYNPVTPNTSPTFDFSYDPKPIFPGKTEADSQTNKEIFEKEWNLPSIFIDQNLMSDIIRDPSVEDIVFIRNELSDNVKDNSIKSRCRAAARQMGILKKLKAVHKDIQEKSDPNPIKNSEKNLDGIFDNISQLPEKTIGSSSSTMKQNVDEPSTPLEDSDLLQKYTSNGDTAYTFKPNSASRSYHSSNSLRATPEIQAGTSRTSKKPHNIGKIRKHKLNFSSLPPSTEYIESNSNLNEGKLSSGSESSYTTAKHGSPIMSDDNFSSSAPTKPHPQNIPSKASDFTKTGALYSIPNQNITDTTLNSREDKSNTQSDKSISDELSESYNVKQSSESPNYTNTDQVIDPPKPQESFVPQPIINFLRTTRRQRTTTEADTGGDYSPNILYSNNMPQITTESDVSAATRNSVDLAQKVRPTFYQSHSRDLIDPQSPSYPPSFDADTTSEALSTEVFRGAASPYASKNVVSREIISSTEPEEESWDLPENNADSDFSPMKVTPESSTSDDSLIFTESNLPIAPNLQKRATGIPYQEYDWTDESTTVDLFSSALSDSSGSYDSNRETKLKFKPENVHGAHRSKPSSFTDGFAEELMTVDIDKLEESVPDDVEYSESTNSFNFDEASSYDSTTKDFDLDLSPSKKVERFLDPKPIIVLKDMVKSNPSSSQEESTQNPFDESALQDISTTQDTFTTPEASTIKNLPSTNHINRLKGLNSDSPSVRFRFSTFDDKMEQTSFNPRMKTSTSGLLNTEEDATTKANKNLLADKQYESISVSDDLEPDTTSSSIEFNGSQKTRQPQNENNKITKGSELEEKIINILEIDAKMTSKKEVTPKKQDSNGNILIIDLERPALDSENLKIGTREPMNGDKNYQTDLNFKGNKYPSSSRNKTKKIKPEKDTVLRYPDLPKFDVSALENKYAPFDDLKFHPKRKNQPGKKPTKIINEQKKYDNPNLSGDDLKKKIDSAFYFAELDLPMDLETKNKIKDPKQGAYNYDDDIIKVYGDSNNPKMPHQSNVKKLKTTFSADQKALKQNIKQKVANTAVAGGSISTFFIILLKENETVLNLEKMSEKRDSIEVDDLCVPLYSNGNLFDFTSITKLITSSLYFQNSKLKIPIFIRKNGRKCSSLKDYDIIPPNSSERDKINENLNDSQSEGTNNKKIVKFKREEEDKAGNLKQTQTPVLVEFVDVTQSTENDKNEENEMKQLTPSTSISHSVKPSEMTPLYQHFLMVKNRINAELDSLLKRSVQNYNKTKR